MGGDLRHAVSCVRVARNPFRTATTNHCRLAANPNIAAHAGDPRARGHRDLSPPGAARAVARPAPRDETRDRGGGISTRRLLVSRRGFGMDAVHAGRGSSRSQCCRIIFSQPRDFRTAGGCCAPRRATRGGFCAQKISRARRGRWRGGGCAGGGRISPGAGTAWLAREPGRDARPHLLGGQIQDAVRRGEMARIETRLVGARCTLDPCGARVLRRE
jgi:hypothetical protein